MGVYNDDFLDASIEVLQRRRGILSRTDGTLRSPQIDVFFYVTLEGLGNVEVASEANDLGYDDTVILKEERLVWEISLLISPRGPSQTHTQFIVVHHMR